MTDVTISDEMRDLIVQYMEACNKQQYAEAEGILQQIKEQGVIDHEKRST